MPRRSETDAFPEYFSRLVLKATITCEGNKAHHPSREHPHWFKAKIDGVTVWWCKDCLPQAYRQATFADALRHD